MINNITNKPLNTNYSYLSNLTTLPTISHKYLIHISRYGHLEGNVKNNSTNKKLYFKCNEYHCRKDPNMFG